MSLALRQSEGRLVHTSRKTLLRAVNAGAGAVIVDADSRSDSRARAPQMGVREMSFKLTADGPAGRAGDLIRLAVTPDDTTNVNEELDTWLGGYENFGYLADLVCPVVLVDQEKARRRDFTLDNTFEVVETRVGRHGGINEIEHMSETVGYETEEHALAGYVPFGAQEGERYDVKRAHVEMIANKLALAREVRVFGLLTNTASWDANNRTTLSSGTLKWNTGANKDPLGDLHARIKASASKVTGLVMNEDVLFYFLADNNVRAQMRQMYGDNAPDPELARAASAQAITTFTLLGLPPITVAPAKRKNPTTGILESILGDDVILLAQPPGVPVDGTRMATCMTFRTKGRSGTGWTTNEYIPQTGRGLEKGTMIESGYKETIFMASPLSGGLIKDVLS